MPNHDIFWHTLESEPKVSPTLTQDISTDIVIIGGGIAGLTAAYHLAEKGRSITLVEQDVCASGASGKSSGFITPDSELEFGDLLERFGEEGATTIWNFGQGGVDEIRRIIQGHNISCDYREDDSCFIALNKKGYTVVEDEYQKQQQFLHQSSLYDKSTVTSIIGSNSYAGAVRFGKTFGINPYNYCRSLKQIIEEKGVTVFEKTSVTAVNADGVWANNHYIKAKIIVVCVDRFLPQLKIYPPKIYRVQTYLAVSAPLSSEVVSSLFPNGPLMVWDTSLIYQYFRIVAGNRLLVGASSLLKTYSKQDVKTPEYVIRKMEKYVHEKFNGIHIKFEYTWPGLLGITKDFFPIAGKHSDMPNVFYISGAAGLPWATALGKYISEKIIDNRSDLDKYFSATRKFPVGNRIQKILGKPLSYAISHGASKYFK